VVDAETVLQPLRRSLRPALLAVAGALALTVLTPAPDALAACPGAARTLSPAQARNATLCLLNGVRRSNGLPALHSNGLLATAARLHAQDMAAGQYFSHTSLDGRSPAERIRQVGYLTGRERSWTVGENLGWEAAQRATPGQMVAAWMASPAHRANILSGGYREAGFGAAAAPAGGSQPARIVYVTDFGRRR
jgi:uncharacterized protein YkwD